MTIQDAMKEQGVRLSNQNRKWIVRNPTSGLYSVYDERYERIAIEVEESEAVKVLMEDW